MHIQWTLYYEVTERICEWQWSKATDSVGRMIMTTLRMYYRLHCYLFSWHKHTWGHILARREIRTNKYIHTVYVILTAVSSTSFIPFHTNLKFWLIKQNFRTITWRISCYDFKTILICCEIWKLMLLNISISHIQLHIYGFSYTADLLGSSRSTETYLRDEELQNPMKLQFDNTVQICI